jgi:hypothetical protein
MSFIYVTKVMSDDSMMASTTTKDLRRAVVWASKNTIEGDTVIIKEGYVCADQGIDEANTILNYVV